MSANELITLPDLARRLKLHPTTARGLYKRGAIPGVKIGYRTLRFDYIQVLETLQRNGDPAAAQAQK